MNDTDYVQANVMLSYPLPEAEALLQEKLDAAQASFSNCEEDLDFLREQITVRSPRPWLIHSPANLLSRQWKSPRHEYIIGMSANAGRRMSMGKAGAQRRRANPMVEVAYELLDKSKPLAKLA